MESTPGDGKTNLALSSFCSVQDPAQRMVSPMFRGRLLASAKSFWNRPYRHNQRQISTMILSPAELTMEIRHPRAPGTRKRWWLGLRLGHGGF